MTPVSTAARPTVAVSTHRPRYEGVNIRTWVGFKHFLYIVEESLLGWLREHTPGARHLYHEHGLGVEIVDCSALLPAVLELDDEVTARVEPLGTGRFAVTLSALRDGTETTVLRGRATIALIRERDAPARRPLCGDAARLWLPQPVERIGSGSSGGNGGGGDAAPTAAFSWSWAARYFLCHYSDRVQHSAYTRVLEESVDRFLADRGISVGRMLAQRGWIPVVSRVRVQMLAAASMEETVHTTFVVDDVLRATMFDGRMDCYVERDGQRVHTATARILHGYAVSRGPQAGSLATLDDDVIAALTRDGAR